MQGMFGSVEFSFAVFGDNFKMRVANVVSFFSSLAMSNCLAAGTEEVGT